ncbi:MAG: TSUP family transporter [Flavobacteriales bacterium]
MWPSELRCDGDSYNGTGCLQVQRTTLVTCIYLRMSMDYLIVILVALCGACLSFFSGFGLGTLLLPAFMLFFPPPVAIAATAVVHMLNNVFKLFLVGRYADKKIILGFGSLSVAGALLGAWLLSKVLTEHVLLEYAIGQSLFQITFIKLTIAVLIFIFAVLEIAPWFQSITISRRWLPVGGFLSGLFGGLSGHQGALRSAFLMKSGLSKEAFMGTRVVCACLVDITRITVYAATIGASWQLMNPWLVGAATMAAFSGAWLGNKWMKKTELTIINRIVTVMLLLFAVALGLGVI